MQVARGHVIHIQTGEMVIHIRPGGENISVRIS